MHLKVYLKIILKKHPLTTTIFILNYSKILGFLLLFFSLFSFIYIQISYIILCKYTEFLTAIQTDS